MIGIALGYEDLVDHDDLRRDPVLAAVLGKLTPRRKECAPLAGKSTLSRLEHAPEEGPASAPPRYHKIRHDGAAIERTFLDIALRSRSKPPPVMVIDLDATDTALHGHQEGRFFHGYYDCYCYLPLFVFWDRHLLSAKLRPANIDAAAGSVEEVARIVAQVRARWPRTTIIVRADSGFCRDDLMSWCETNGVHFVLGLARNLRLVAEIADELAEAEAAHRTTGRPTRVFKDFAWTTLDSWSRSRRVIAKAEWTRGEANPRFIVTSLPADVIDGARLYEKDLVSAAISRAGSRSHCRVAMGWLRRGRSGVAQHVASRLQVPGIEMPVSRLDHLGARADQLGDHRFGREGFA